MQTSFNGMKNSMLGDFLPAFSTTMDGLSMIFSGSDIDGGLKMIEDGVKGLADGLVQKAPEIFAIGGSILTALLGSITQNLPVLLNAGVPVIMELANSLISAAPQILSAVMSLIGTIGSALADPANLQNLIDSAVAIVMMISDGISQNAETVIPAIVEVIMQMLTALTDESVLMPLLSAGLSVITSVVQGILKAIPVLIKNLPAIITNIVNFLVNSTPLIIQAAIQLLGGIISAIPQIIVELVKALPQIISSIVSGLLGGIGQIVSVGGQLLSGLWQGISDKIGWIVEKIKGFGNTVLNTIKGIFGIHSPSKVFRDEVGKMLALGLGEGFEDELSNTSKEMAKSASGLVDDVSEAMKMEGLSVNGDVSMDGYSVKAPGSLGSDIANGNSALLDSIGAYIDAKMEKIQLEANFYLSGRKIDNQIVTAVAKGNMISGGR
jgi:phage-related protein